jgi:hypothetical protein
LVLNPQRLVQQAAQILNLMGRDELHVKNAAPPFARISDQAKIAGRFWRTNQKRTGNCECTRARGMTQEKVC